MSSTECVTELSFKTQRAEI